MFTSLFDVLTPQRIWLRFDPVCVLKCRHRFLLYGGRAPDQPRLLLGHALPGGTWHGEMPDGFTEGCVPPILPKLINVLELNDGCPVQYVGVPSQHGKDVCYGIIAARVLTATGFHGSSGVAREDLLNVRSMHCPCEPCRSFVYSTPTSGTTRLDHNSAPGACAFEEQL